MRITTATIRSTLVLLAVAAATGTAPLRAAEVMECIVAQVNGDIITLSDLQKQKIALLDDIYRQKLSDAETQRRLDDAKAHFLASLIEEKLLIQKANDLGLTVGKDEVDRIIKSIMEQNKIADDAALERALKEEGLSSAQLHANIEKRTLIEKVKQFEVASKVVVTDEETKRYYDSHRDEFKEPERVRLREIVLITEKRDEQQVQKEIEEIAGLVRNGADFAELATLFSQAPTAEHGGDLGLVRTTDLAPDIVDTAGKLQVGQVSDAIRSKFGFHILKLVERKALAFRTMAEAKDDIVRKVQDSQLGEKLTVYLEQLRASAYVKVNDICKSKAM